MRYLIFAILFLSVFAFAVIAEELEEPVDDYVYPVYQTNVTTLAISETELKLAIAMLKLNDPNIGVLYTNIGGGATMTYKEPALLFSLFHVNYPIHVTIKENGRISVKNPWYHFALKNDEVLLKERFDAAVDSAQDFYQLDNIYSQQHLTMLIIQNVGAQTREETLTKYSR